MTIIELIDKHLSRMTGEGVAGAGIFLMTGVIFWLTAKYPSLRGDDLFKTLAQAVVVQGLIGLAMASWFTNRARKTVREEFEKRDALEADGEFK